MLNNVMTRNINTNKLWRFENIPDSEQCKVKELFNKKLFDELFDLYKKYNVIKTPYCPSCNGVVTIAEWTKYAIDKNWII